MAGLRTQAEADLASILENDATGFGWPIRITDPDGQFADVIGDAGEISQLIDPDTGLAVSGNLAHVTLRISTLKSKGLDVPKGIADTAAKPWRITFDDINGNSYTFKVRQSRPDAMLGIVVCILEIYGNGAC